MTVIHDRATNEMVKHDATHRHPPGHKCEDAACAAGAMKDISHFRGRREDERKATRWHMDIVGPTTTGIGVDAAGNLQTGTHAIIFANDLDRDVSTCTLRKGTTSAETKENINALKSRYHGTELDPDERRFTTGARR